MNEYRRSRWPCQVCSRVFLTRESLLADLKAHQVHVRDLIAEFESAVGRSKPQPLSSSSEDENDQSLTLRTNTTFGGTSRYRCPCNGCTEKEGMLKRSLRRHYTTHISISEICGFCKKSFGNLRQFVLHLDEKCKVKKKLKEKGSHLNKEQKETIKRKKELYEESTMELNQQLNIKGTMGDESSVVGDAKSYNNSLIEGGNEGATPELLALRGRDGGDGDEDTSVTGSSIIHSCPFESSQEALHPRTGTSIGGRLPQSENNQLIHSEESHHNRKRRREDTIVSANSSLHPKLDQPREKLNEGLQTITPEQDPLQKVDRESPLVQSHATRAYEGEAETASLSGVQNRQIQYMFSKAPTSQVPLLRDLLLDAIQNSRQWQNERELGEVTTDCLTIMIPADFDQDISVTLWVGRVEGFQIIEQIMLQGTWSAEHGHLSLQPPTLSEPRFSYPS